jgi:hypothetical protein
MPGQRFTVQLDPDDLALSDFTAALSRTEAGPRISVDHHGAHDERQAARQRSERAHADRAAGAGTTRSYAFRRS